MLYCTFYVSLMTCRLNNRGFAYDSDKVTVECSEIAYSERRVTNVWLNHANVLIYKCDSFINVMPVTVLQFFEILIYFIPFVILFCSIVTKKCIFKVTKVRYRPLLIPKLPG